MTTTKKAMEIATELSGLSKSEVVLMSKFTPKPFADEILKEHSFKYDNLKRFWIYDQQSGLWLEDAENFIKNLLRKNLFGETQLKQNYTNEVVKHIQDISWTREIPEDLDKNLIAFNNCLVNIDTKEIIPFSNKYFITSKVYIDLNENIKECPKIDKFFENLIGKENKSILYDLMAYCFYRQYPYQKMFIFHGAGENGKTSYLDLLTHVLGQQNISSETPQELTQPGGFSKGNLWKKFANVSSELPYTALADTNTIKGLCGGDIVKCNRKFKEPFQFKNFAKLVFAGNELPATNDKTYAFARRLYIIKFGTKIKNPIKNFVDTLLTKEELDGLGWKCFEYLIKQKERGWCFEIDVNVEEMLKLYEELSNPLSKFLKENVVEDSEGFIFKYEFRDVYKEWCKDKGFRIWSDTELSKILKHDYNEGKRVAWKEGEQKRYNAWLGISFKFQGDSP